MDRYSDSDGGNFKYFQGESAASSTSEQDSGLDGFSLNEMMAIKSEIHSRLIDLMDDSLLKTTFDDRSIPRIRSLAQKVIEARGLSLSSRFGTRLLNEVMDEVLGYGPIDPLLKDDEVTEIMVNQPRQVYVERHGMIEKTRVAFKDDAHVMRIIEKIVSSVGRRVDESSPMVDARLPDGSRVNVIIPPLAIKGPTITIRKFARDPFKMRDLVSFGTLTEGMGDFLKACVETRLNLIISGGTGSGKTSTLNVLSAYIPANERIVTIEDAAELQLRQEHVVTLESRPPNIEGKGTVAIRDLVRNSLRMRPDRIIVGEVRGAESLDMLQAMNTGHDGCMSTCHTNSPRDTLSRLETMTLMAGMDLPTRAIREQIAAAIDLIVHQNRFPDGTRKITHITEVQGMEGDVVVLQDIFVYYQKGVGEKGKILGNFRYTGLRPRFLDKFAAAGVALPEGIFDTD